MPQDAGRETRAPPTLVFDLDGTLLRPPQFREYLWHTYRIGDTLTHTFFSGTFRECQVGRSDLKLALAEALPTWGWHGSVQDFMEEWFEIDYQPKDEVLAMIADLRRGGTLCYVASNQEQYRADYVSTRLGLPRRFDGALFSFQVGYRKPSPPFMSALEDYVSRGPHGAFILVDDNAEVRSRAVERGWQAWATVDPTSFQK